MTFVNSEPRQSRIDCRFHMDLVLLSDLHVPNGAPTKASPKQPRFPVSEKQTMS